MSKESARGKKHDVNPSAPPPVAALRSMTPPSVDPQAIIDKLSQAAREALTEEQQKVLDFSATDDTALRQLADNVVSSQTEPGQTELGQVAPMQREAVQRDSVQTGSVQTDALQSDGAQDNLDHIALAKNDLVQFDLVQFDPVHSEKVQSETVQTEPAQGEAVQTEPAQTEPVQTYLGLTDLGLTTSGQSIAQAVEQAQANQAKTNQARASKFKAGQAKTEKTKADHSKNDQPATAETSNTTSDEDTLSHPDSGIEILVKMAEKGEIDPKNVDIIDVCDKFLKAIASTPKESLRMSGKVIFHAAVLLRLKAEALLSEANNVMNPVVDDFLDFDADGGPIIYDSNKQEIGRQLTFKDLEGAIVRRAQRKPAVRERRVTLDQLILALKEAEKLEKVRQEKKPKAPRIDLSGYNEVNDVDDILDLAHDEDIEGTIVKVEQWLAANLPLGETVELFQLVKKVNRKQDWVEAFLAALFLSNAGKIDLTQDTFYGPLYLSLCQQILDSASDQVAKSG
jgi:segregation and condensation protein A